MDDSIDIMAKAPFPAGALSNFAPHPFVLDGVACACMEGFLQSLKVQEVSEQLRVCGLDGPTAKSIGSELDWRVNGTLWWLGTPMDRFSDEYQKLLDRAYDALFAQSPEFQAALIATGKARLTHSVGKEDPRETVLTTEELCIRLERLRDRAGHLSMSIVLIHRCQPI